MNNPFDWDRGISNNLASDVTSDLAQRFHWPMIDSVIGGVKGIQPGTSQESAREISRFGSR
jgi:hypothetical protein